MNVTKRVCEKCGGYGYIRTESTENSVSAKTCPVCNGFGFVFNERPTTNADRIRAMSDEKLARFLATKSADAHLNSVEQGLTAVQIEALRSSWYHAWKQWLKQPVEE